MNGNSHSKSIANVCVYVCVCGDARFEVAGCRKGISSYRIAAEVVEREKERERQRR